MTWMMLSSHKSDVKHLWHIYNLFSFYSTIMNGNEMIGLYTSKTKSHCCKYCQQYWLQLLTYENESVSMRSMIAPFSVSLVRSMSVMSRITIWKPIIGITAYFCCDITNFGVLLNPYASWINKVGPCYFGSCLIMIMEQEKTERIGN